MSDLELDGGSPHSEHLPQTSPKGDDDEWKESNLAPGQVASDYEPSQDPYPDEFVNADRETNVGGFAPGPFRAEEDYYCQEPDVSGACGLVNLGNTCYFNSAVQCLVCIPQLCHYFLAQDGGFHDTHRLSQCAEVVSKALNIDSARKELAVATNQFCAIMTKVWTGAHPYTSPAGLHSAVGKAHRQFDNLRQHDSQELLLFLVNGVHEDLQIRTCGLSPPDRETCSVAEPTPAMPSTANDTSAADSSPRGITEEASDEVPMSGAASAQPRPLLPVDPKESSLKSSRRLEEEDLDSMPRKIPCMSGDNSLPDFSECAAREADKSNPSSPMTLAQGGAMTMDTDDGGGAESSGVLVAAHVEVLEEKSYMPEPNMSMSPEESTISAPPSRASSPGPDKVDSTIISDTFQGEFRSEITCCECNNASVQLEPFLCLSVPLPGATELKICVVWVPRFGVRRSHLVTVSRRSTVADIKEALTKRLHDESVAGDGIGSTVAATLQRWKVGDVLDDSFAAIRLQNQPLYLFELNPPLVPPADTEKLTALLPGKSILFYSSLSHVESGKRPSGTSDTDSGFTQSSGSSSAGTERVDCMGGSTLSSDTLAYYSRGATSPSHGDASSVVSDSCSSPARSIPEQAGPAPATDPCRPEANVIDKLVSLGCLSGSGLAIRSGHGLQQQQMKKALTKESSDSIGNASAASPQSTVSSADSVAGRSEVSTDSLSSTSNALNKLSVDLSEAGSETAQSPAMLRLEEDKGMVQTLPPPTPPPSPPPLEAMPAPSSRPPSGSSPSPAPKSVPATPPVSVPVSYESPPVLDTSPVCPDADLPMALDHFATVQQTHPLEVCGTGIASTLPAAGSHHSSEPVSSDMTVGGDEEVYASHSDSGPTATDASLPLAAYSEQEFRYETDAVPEAEEGEEACEGTESVYQYSGDGEIECPFCFELCPASMMMMHRGCTAKLCQACIERGLECNANTSYPCDRCGLRVDIATDYVPLTSGPPPIRSFRIPVIVRHLESPQRISIDQQFAFLGPPFILQLPSRVAAADLYDLVTKKITSLGFGPGIDDFSEAGSTSISASLHNEFVISLVQGKGLPTTCCRCSVSCPGCVIPRSGCVELHGTDTLAVTFPAKVDPSVSAVLENIACDASMAEQRENNFIMLSECLEEFAREEKLTGDNPFDCPQCESKVEAIKSLTASKLPPVLLLQMKRFIYYQGALGEKLENPVRFALRDVDFGSLLFGDGGGDSTEEMDTSTSLSGIAPGSATVCTDSAQTTTPSTTLYDAIAFICHSGSVNCGHYTTFAYHPKLKEWYYYNDRTVTKRHPKSEDMDKAYVVVYAQQGVGPEAIPEPGWSLEMAYKAAPYPLISDVPEVPQVSSSDAVTVPYAPTAENTRDQLEEVANRLRTSTQQKQHKADRCELLGQADTTPPFTVSPLDDNSPTFGSVALPSRLDPPPDGALAEYAPGSYAADVMNVDYMTDYEKLRYATERSMAPGSASAARYSLWPVDEYAPDGSQQWQQGSPEAWKDPVEAGTVAATITTSSTTASSSTSTAAVPLSTSVVSSSASAAAAATPILHAGDTGRSAAQLDSCISTGCARSQPVSVDGRGTPAFPSMTMDECVYCCSPVQAACMDIHMLSCSVFLKYTQPGSSQCTDSTSNEQFPVEESAGERQSSVESSSTHAEGVTILPENQLDLLTEPAVGGEQQEEEEEEVDIDT